VARGRRIFFTVTPFVIGCVRLAPGRSGESGDGLDDEPILDGRSLGFYDSDHKKTRNQLFTAFVNGCCNTSET
jgi:hypothetical protein